MPKWLNRLRKLISLIDKSRVRVLAFAEVKSLPPFFMESLTEEEAERIRIYDSVVYVRSTAIGMHRFSTSGIGTDILASPYSINRGYSSQGPNTFVLVNKYDCGTLFKKASDYLISSPEEGGVPRISLELAFTLESINSLYLESAHELTEYTTIDYSIGMKIYDDPFENDFEATIFAMKRTPGNPSADKITLKDANYRRFQNAVTAYNSVGIIEKYNLVANYHEFPHKNLDEQMNKFGVELFFTRKIDESNYKNDIVITLDSVADDNICIRGFSIEMIREDFLHWWQKRHELERAEEKYKLPVIRRGFFFI